MQINTEINMSGWEQGEIVRLLKGQPGTRYQEGDVLERTIMRDWVRSLLHTSIVDVEFVKSDGSIRVMKCTLNYDHIPPAAIPKGPSLKGFNGITSSNPDYVTELYPFDSVINLKEDSEKPKEETSIKVYDVEASAWRSFRYDRLRKITSTISFE
tara:strand:+ start:4090 stop:4554 length:465 start_codon:yes stop_codon:yes gene_type:complete